MAIFKIALNNLFDNEELFISPDDLYGVSNHGISLRFLQSIGKNFTEGELNKLTKEEVEDIYFQHLWLPNEYQSIDSQQIANKVFHTATKLGIKTANRFLQQAINFYDCDLIVDGDLKENELITLNFITEDDEKEILSLYRLLQKEHYSNIIINRPEKINYFQEWINFAEL